MPRFGLWLSTGLLLCCAGCALGFSGAPVVVPRMGMRQKMTMRRSSASSGVVGASMKWGKSQRKDSQTALDAMSVAVKGGVSQLLLMVARQRRYGGGMLDVRPEGLPQTGLDMDESQVLSYLHRHGVDTSEWGMGLARKPMDLVKEVRRGESVLADGKRVIYVVKVQIHDGEYDLFETRQHILSNGSIKERNRCLSEKFSPRETPLEAAHRGIREELNDVVGDFPLVSFRETPRGQAESFVVEGFSSSFPNLKTRYHFFKVDCEVGGLRRDVTGINFVTDEGKGRLHEWEWRRRPQAAKATDAPLEGAYTR